MYKTFQLKLTNLTEEDKSYFSRLFAEAKWSYNDIIEFNNPFEYKTSKTVFKLKLRDDSERTETCRYFSAAMREIQRLGIVRSIKSLNSMKTKGFKVGKIKFKSFVNSITLYEKQIKIKKNSVRFQKYNKYFSVRGLDQLPPTYNLRLAFLLRKASGIYLNICIETEDLTTKKSTLPYLGVDFGIKSDFTFSEGTVVSFNISNKIQKLKQLHRELSRKKKNSSRWKKAKSKLNKYYEHVVNCKNDFSNKLGNILKNNYAVCFQDEQLNNWSHKFGSKIQKSILGRLKLMLKRNINNLEIDRFKPTTKQCFKCSKINNISLKQREYRCECGYSCDRDINAAKNMIKLTGAEYASAEQSDIFENLVRNIQSAHFAVKREVFG